MPVAAAAPASPLEGRLTDGASTTELHAVAADTFCGHSVVVEVQQVPCCSDRLEVEDWAADHPDALEAALAELDCALGLPLTGLWL